MVSKVKPAPRRILPYVDARLPDGSRINAIIPPVCLTGACLTVRKFRKEAFSLEELVLIGSVSQDAAEYLREAVQERRNIIVSGGTGSGKTTLLNALSQFIPDAERIVTIEDCGGDPASEAPRDLPRGETGQHRRVRSRHHPDLVRNSLRMRPDRIIVGEVPRGRGARHAAGDEYGP